MGILLGVGEELAIGFGGGTKTGAADVLLVGAGIAGLHPEAPDLLVARQDISDPVAAAPALQAFVTTLA
jgi:hypothetical protein